MTVKPQGRIDRLYWGDTAGLTAEAFLQLADDVAALSSFAAGTVSSLNLSFESMVVVGDRPAVGQEVGSVPMDDRPQAFSCQVSGTGVRLDISVNHGNHNVVLRLSGLNDDRKAADAVLALVEERIPPLDRDTEEEAKKLGELRTRYAATMKEVKRAGDAAKRAASAAEKATGALANAESALKEIDALKEGAGAGRNAIDATKEKVDRQAGLVEEAQQAVANARREIEAFHKNVQKNQQKLDGLVDAVEKVQGDAKSFVGTMKAEMAEGFEQSRESADDLVEAHDVATRAVIDENTKLQEQIRELLQKANAGTLFHSFEHRKNELQSERFRWLIGVIVTTVLVTGYSLFWVVFKDHTGLELGLRLAAGLPLLLIDYFFVTQYGRCQRVLEEYAFKSAISLSLVAYEDLIKTQEADTESVKFVIETVQRIYESPTTGLRPRDPLDDFDRVAKTLKKNGILDLAKVNAGVKNGAE